ncbi:hypothetical protein D9M68_710000 [compost metagenome]
MNPNDLDVVSLEPLEAILDGAQSGICGIVVHDLVRPPILEDVALFTEIASAHVLDFIENQAANLGTDHIVLAWPPGERPAHTDFRQTGAVERGVIEVADSIVPGSVHCRLCLRLWNVAEHVAQRCSTKPELAGKNVFQCHDSLLIQWSATKAGAAPGVRAVTVYHRQPLASGNSPTDAVAMPVSIA